MKPRVLKSKSLSFADKDRVPVTRLGVFFQKGGGGEDTHRLQFLVFDHKSVYLFSSSPHQLDVLSPIPKHTCKRQNQNNYRTIQKYDRFSR